MTLHFLRNPFKALNQDILVLEFYAPDQETAAYWITKHLTAYYDANNGGNPPMVKQSQPFRPIDFVTINLTEEQRNLFGSWVDSVSADLDDLLSALLQQNKKLSVSYVESSDSFCASVTDRDSGSINYNCCVSSFHRTAVEAVWLAIYKVMYLHPEKQWSTLDRNASWG